MNKIYLLVEGMSKHDNGSIWGFTENKVNADLWKKSKPSNKCYIRYYKQINNINYMFEEKPKLKYLVRFESSIKNKNYSSISYKDNKPCSYGYECIIITNDLDRIEEYIKNKFNATVKMVQQVSPQFLIKDCETIDLSN